MVEWAIEHAGGDKIEVIARLMRMFLCGGNAKESDLTLAHLGLAGALSRMRVLAQRQSDGGQDKVDAIALVKALEIYWNFLSRADDTIVAKGWSILGDRVL